MQHLFLLFLDYFFFKMFWMFAYEPSTFRFLLEANDKSVLNPRHPSLFLENRNNVIGHGKQFRPSFPYTIRTNEMNPFHQCVPPT